LSCASVSGRCFCFSRHGDTNEQITRLSPPKVSCNPLFAREREGEVTVRSTQLSRERPHGKQPGAHGPPVTQAPLDGPRDVTCSLPAAATPYTPGTAPGIRRPGAVECRDLRLWPVHLPATGGMASSCSVLRSAAEAARARPNRVQPYGGITLRAAAPVARRG
jgi:hypothetical protein